MLAIPSPAVRDEGSAAGGAWEAVAALAALGAGAGAWVCAGLVLDALKVEHVTLTIARIGLAGTAGAVAAAVAYAYARLLVGRPDTQQVELGEGADRSAFIEIGNPDVVADAAVRLFWGRESWIYRRVERISFMDETLVRRRVSIDFEIPHSAVEVRSNHPASGDGGEDVRRFLPVSVLRSWPPVLNLDLRDDRGRPIPLLSRATSNAVDQKVLSLVGKRALGDAVDEVLGELVTRVVHGEGMVARRALIALQDVLSQDLAEHTADERAAMTEPCERFIDLAAVLIDSTILWVPVDGEVGDRCIVKLAYDEPVRRKLLAMRGAMTAMGWRSTVVAFDVPHIGDTNSYHLELEAPEGLEVVDVRLTMSTDEQPPNPARRVWTRLCAWMDGLSSALAVALDRMPPPRLRSPDRHRRLLKRRAQLYVRGDRRRALGQATLLMLPERLGALLPPAVAATLVAGALTALRSLDEEIYAAAVAAPPRPAPLGAAIAFLLVAPGLLTYVLLRSDHALTRRLLIGVRAASSVSVLLSVTAAGLLIWCVVERDPDLLEAAIGWMTWASYALAAMLAVSFPFPLRRSWRRDD